MDEFLNMTSIEYNQNIATDKTQCVRVVAKERNIVFRGDDSSIRVQIVENLETAMPNVEIDPSTIQIVVMKDEISVQAPATLAACLVTMPIFAIMINDAFVPLLRTRFTPSPEVRAKLMEAAQWLQVRVGPYDTTPHEKIVVLVAKHLATYGIIVLTAHCRSRYDKIAKVRIGYIHITIKDVDLRNVNLKLLHESTSLDSGDGTVHIQLPFEFCTRTNLCYECKRLLNPDGVCGFCATMLKSKDEKEKKKNNDKMATIAFKARDKGRASKAMQMATEAARREAEEAAAAEALLGASSGTH